MFGRPTAVSLHKDLKWSRLYLLILFSETLRHGFIVATPVGWRANRKWRFPALCRPALCDFYVLPCNAQLLSA